MILKQIINKQSSGFIKSFISSHKVIYQFNNASIIAIINKILLTAFLGPKITVFSGTIFV